MRPLRMMMNLSRKQFQQLVFQPQQLGIADLLPGDRLLVHGPLFLEAPVAGHVDVFLVVQLDAAVLGLDHDVLELFFQHDLARRRHQLDDLHDARVGHAHAVLDIGRFRGVPQLGLHVGRVAGELAAAHHRQQRTPLEGSGRPDAGQVQQGRGDVDVAHGRDDAPALEILVGRMDAEGHVVGIGAAQVVAVAGAVAIFIQAFAMVGKNDDDRVLCPGRSSSGIASISPTWSSNMRTEPS